MERYIYTVYYSVIKWVTQNTLQMTNYTNACFMGCNFPKHINGNLFPLYANILLQGHDCKIYINYVERFVICM